MAECDPQNCPTGKDLKHVHKALEDNTAEQRTTRDAIIESTVQMGHIVVTLAEHKADNERDHDSFYKQLRAVDKEVAKKLDLKTIGQASGMIVAVLGFLWILIKFATVGQ